MSQINPSLAEKNQHVQYKYHREQAQAYINQLLLFTRKMEGVKSQIRFLMKCKKHNIIPKGLKSGFLASISNFSQSGQRLCERFQKNSCTEFYQTNIGCWRSFKGNVSISESS